MYYINTCRENPPMFKKHTENMKVRERARAQHIGYITIM